MWVDFCGLAKCCAYWPQLRIAGVMCSRLRSVGVFVCAMARVAGDVGLRQQTQLGQTIAHNEHCYDQWPEVARTILE